MTSSRSDSPPRPGATRTASTICSVAATPTSAEISASSSASTVSTSIGRLRCAGLVGAADDLVEPLDELLLGPRQRLLDLVEETHDRSPERVRIRFPHAGGAQHAGALDRFARRDVRPSSTAAIWAAIGSSMPWRAPSASAAPVVRTPSATMCISARISRSGRPRPSSMPTWRLRLRSPVQVSTRSPRPLRPASVSRRPPSAHASREISDEAARDERRHRVVPEAEAFDDAGGNRDDVLQRAADLDAGHVVAGVEAQRRALQAAPARAPPPPGSAEARPRPPSAARARLRRAKLGPESTTTGWPPPVSSAHHLRHAVAASRVLEPLRRADDDRAAAEAEDGAARTTARSRATGPRR